MPAASPVARGASRLVTALAPILASVLAALLCAPPVLARTLQLQGSMDSRMDYELDYEVTPHAAMRRLTLSFVQPVTFTSPTYSQRVERFGLDFSTEPDSRDTAVDKRGNTVLTATWNTAPPRLLVRYGVDALVRTELPEVRSSAPFPPTPVSDDARPYLAATAQVQSDDPAMVAKARELTRGAASELEAVRAVMAFVVDKVRYVSPPRAFDALYSLRTGKGNCQNFSHLAAALLRAVGVPVRIVNGVTVDTPYDVAAGGTVFTTKMGRGRHSWVEVWFPDLGWVPFDAQNSVMFVANRYLRTEVGLDNAEAVHDGRMTWTQAAGSPGRPRMAETYAADMPRDEIVLSGRLLPTGPVNLLRVPRLASLPAMAAAEPARPRPAPVEPRPAPTQPEPAKPEPAKPEPVKPAPGPLPLTRPVVLGNLDFPENVDFSETRTVSRDADGGYSSTRTFLVETAEYVTSKLTQYAQAVILGEPLKLESVGLALHKFGGSGQLWVELRADDHGRPGQVLGSSALADLAELSLRPGYRWRDFDFAAEGLTLEPGRYWIALGFTGDAVVNWFFTYGKPVGPTDGTRYKGVFDAAWSGALSYEFNYRVAGLGPAR